MPHFYKKIFQSFFLILISLISAGQAGVVPVTPPIGGFSIDGFLKRQGAGGDWLAGPGGNQTGTFILSDIGVPLIPSSLFTHTVDLWGNDNDDVFANNSKFKDNPNEMRWTLKKANAKNDINHGIVFFTLDPSNGHIWAILSGDRFNPTGTDIIDFEFLQNPIVRTAIGNNGTGGFVSSGPNDGRTIGDIVISVQLSNGNSSFGSVSVSQWQPINDFDFTYVNLAPFAGTLYTAINGGTIPIDVPYGAFGSNTYPSRTFAEAAVDMTALIGGSSGGQCFQSTPFRTIWIKSRSSSSSTAQLHDFVELIQVPYNLAGYVLSAGAIFYDLFTADLTASISPGSVDDYNFHWTPSPANPPGGSLSNPNIYNPVFTTTNPEGCISYAYEVQATLKSTGCLIAIKSIALNSPCKIGKPINPDKVNLNINTTNEVVNNKDEVQIYPNPNKGNMTISFTGEFEVRNIDLLDMKGALVQRIQETTNNSIQFKNLKPGLYLLKMTSGSKGKETIKKIVVTN